MNRREFLAKLVRYGLSAGALSALPVERLFAQEFYPQITIPIIDAHAHLPGTLSSDEGYTFEAIRSAKLCATTMAVIGDNKTVVGADSTYLKAKEGISHVRLWETQKLVKIVRRPSDIPLQPNVYRANTGNPCYRGRRCNRNRPWAFRRVLRVGCSDDHPRAWQGSPDGSGDNQIGKDMRRHPSNEDDGGLSDFGYQVVGRMNRLGMVVDVSHASTQTLLDVASCTRAPIIDSHTSMLPPEVTVREHGRQRLYSDAEAIVDTGGVVCTYPYRMMHTVA